MQTPELQKLIQLLSRLPGLGPRSGRRVALHLIKHRETLMDGLIQSLNSVMTQLCTCHQCGNLDTQELCRICESRDESVICVVESVSDLWALERSGAFRGQYHIIGGALSAHQGITPHQLTLSQLQKRIEGGGVNEIILAMSATPEGLATTHYLIHWMKDFPLSVSSIAHGIPLGGELDYLDDGTLQTALHARRSLLSGNS